MKLTLFILTYFSAIFSCAQTGPAGVGSTTSNIVWLKADAGTSTTVNLNPVSQWNDNSGNGNHVTQATANLQPLFRTPVAGQLNGMPAIEFDNNATTNDYMNCADNSTLDNYTGMTSFCAFRFNTGAPAGTPRAIFSKRNDPSSQNDFGWFNYTGTKFFLDVNGTGSRMNTVATYNDNVDYLVSYSFDGTAASNEQKMYTGNSLDAQTNNASANVPNYTSDFHVGVLYGHTGTNKQFNGFIPEIIIYNLLLNPAQYFIVNNYLSSKYNIPVSSNDYYLGDTPANGDFDREVAGIGQSTAGNTNNAFSSSVCAGMGITYVSGFDDGDYLLAGHNLPVNTNFYTDIAVVSGGPVMARWQRIWYVDVTNTATALNTNVTFDLSAGGFTGTTGIASNYKLLYRSTNSGNWTIVASASSTAGDQVYFTGVNFNTNDGYYTIGTLDYYMSTLPVEWLYFDAAAETNGTVKLDWTTATELNSDYFAVERTTDGIIYSEIGRIGAAGNSSSLHTYTTTDPSPADGMNYYRLRQEDLNGVFEYSILRSVEIVNNKYTIQTFPNPSDGSFTLALGTAWIEDNASVTIFAIDGRVVQHFENDELENASISILLSPGIYLVRIDSRSGKSSSMRQIVH
ncbi:MAG: T9SS type A sorting domain-containing protein [Bacteroidota bacterium]|nr:T9SS type A sorting domain-containing protein [Bacteroidota bacterium]